MAWGNGNNQKVILIKKAKQIMSKSNSHLEHTHVYFSFALFVAISCHLYMKSSGLLNVLWEF